MRCPAMCWHFKLQAPCLGLPSGRLHDTGSPSTITWARCTQPAENRGKQAVSGHFLNSVPFRLPWPWACHAAPRLSITSPRTQQN